MRGDDALGMAMAGPAVRPAVLFRAADKQGKTDADADDDWRLLPGLINPAGPWPPSSDPPTTSSSGKLMFSRDWLCCLSETKQRRGNFNCHTSLTKTAHF